MKQIFLFLNKLIPNDKLLHFFWSSILFVILSNFLTVFDASLLLILIAIIKEVVWDGLLEKGNASFMDFIFGIMPIFIYYILRF